jgi:hypothetical protein
MDQLQFIAILFSLGLVGYILWLIRGQRLKEEYSLLWLIVGAVFFLFSVWRQGLEVLGNVLGIAYAPAALFIIILIGILLILIQFSMIISRLSDRSRIVAQEHALLQERVRELEQKFSARPSECTESGGGSTDPEAGND